MQSWRPRQQLGPSLFLRYLCQDSSQAGEKSFWHVNFAVLMIWQEPKDHAIDCYFCLTNISGISLKSQQTVSYPNLQLS